MSLSPVNAVDLSTLKIGIIELQRERNKLQAISQANSRHLGQDQKLYESTASLIEDADLALSRATSAYEDSMTARSTASTPPGGTGACRTWEKSIAIRSDASNPMRGDKKSPIYQESIASRSVASLPVLSRQPGSKMSPSLSKDNSENRQFDPVSAASVASPGVSVDIVSQWINGLSNLEKGQRPVKVVNEVSTPLTSNGSSPTLLSESLSCRSMGERLNSNRTSSTLPSTSLSPQSVGELLDSDARRFAKTERTVVDDSDEDDIGVELAKNVLSTGKRALDKEDYGAARSCLLEGLSLVQQLPSKLEVAACDMLELRYQLAMCSLSLDSQVVVEKALLEVLQQEPSSDAQREKLFHVSHILAQLYIETGRLSLARQSCNNALRGRRKLFGREHSDYFASLALMARICELENAPIQAQGYKDMIPESERHKHAFHQLRMEAYCEKEAVELVAIESSSQSSELTAHESISQPAVRNTSFAKIAQTITPPESTSHATVRDKSLVEVTQSTQNQPAVSRSAVPSATVIEVAHSTQIPVIAQIAALEPSPSPAAHVRNYVNVPQPNPRNDYLGFCKAAWQLQNGEPKAMKKSKEFNMSSQPVYWLRCSGSKCEFTTEVDLSVIWTWTKVWRTKANQGIAYRWPFLAKSHVRQTKTKDRQTLYKCLFCVFGGIHAPIIQGTDLYFDHIVQKHRSSELSQVVLHKTGCINNRICKDEEEFDINLYPTNSTGQAQLHEESKVVPD